MKAKPATPEFVAWVRDNVTKLLVMTRKIVATGEEHVPVMFVYPRNDELPVQMIPMGPFFDRDVGNKNVAGELHRSIASDEKVLVAIMVNETWTLLRVVPEDEREKMIREGIENHPDRSEAIMFNCIRHTGEQVIATYHIKRPDNTLPDTPNVLMDPVVGILDGDEEHRKLAGEFGGAFGRMVVDPEKN